MSRVVLTRRLLGGGCRRPAARPSPACIAPSTSLESPSVQHCNRALFANRQPPFLPHSHSFSSAAPQKEDTKSTIVELPPNLKFDPRAVSSPFYDVERVETKKKRKGGEKKRAPKQIEASVAAASDAELLGEEKAPSEDVAEASSGNDIAEVDAAEEGELEEEDEEEYDSEEEDEAEERILYDLSTKPDVPRAIPLPQRLHVPVLDIKSGEEVGTFHLSEKTFGNDPVRVDILQRVVVWQRNKKRGRRNAGARTKTISEVSGSGRKVRRQKGMGMARAGHSRPAHWRGGAKAHGPKGRIQDYTTKLNKKVRKMGVRHALSQKLLEGNLIVTGDLAVPTHKTKELDAMLRRLGISGRGGDTALICDDADPDDAESASSVYGGLDVNFKVASGNLPSVHVMNQAGCHVYNMLKNRKLVLSLAAVRSLEERLERDL
ncbi:hypothetical protein ACHAXT_008382 [Thalassiosira profunda]